MSAHSKHPKLLHDLDSKEMSRMMGQELQPTFSTHKPFDFYRAHVSDILARITDLNAADVTRAVQRPDAQQG
jgi:hypothetical protein